MDMCKKTIGVMLGFALLLAGPVHSQESVYPAGTLIIARYAVNSASLRVGDTLIITRTLVNKTAYPLTGLYCTDNFPSAFTVVGQTATINKTGLAVSQVGPFPGRIVAGYNEFEWIIDSPVPSGTPQRIINPGDSITLRIKISCGVAGTYDLPFHSTVCYGSASGIFTTANVLTVTFTALVDTIPPAAIRDLGSVIEYNEYRTVPRASVPKRPGCRSCEVAG